MNAIQRLPAIALVAGLMSSLGAGDEPAPERGVIKGRDGSEIEVEYGFVEVPENRTDPASATITLAYMRVPSTRESPGTAVFPLAGGPGGSSIEIVTRNLIGGGRFYHDLMGGDLVAIDQRGVGRSRPNLDTPTSFELPIEEPGDEKRMLERMREVCREEAERWRERGVDLRGYNTRESADDIDAVRRALGYEKIALWGESYGTHLALATIRRHGQHIDRAVLVGPEGPDHTLKLPSSTQDGLERLAELVAADPEVGRDVPDLVGMLASVLKRFEDGPVYVEVGGRRVGVSRFDLQRQVAYTIGTMHKACDELPAAIAMMADGNLEPLALELVEYRRSAGVGSVMPLVMDCASGVTSSRRERIADEALRCLLGDEVNFPIDGLLDVWGEMDLGDEFRSPLRSEVPVLILVGAADARTPVSNAEELMEHLTNASLIVVENAGHDLNWVQPELRDSWSAFLRGEEVPRTEAAAPRIRFKPVYR